MPELFLYDYNLRDANIELIKKLFEDKPDINKYQCAKELGISVRTLYRWLKKYDLLSESPFK